MFNFWRRIKSSHSLDATMMLCFDFVPGGLFIVASRCAPQPVRRCFVISADADSVGSRSKSHSASQKGSKNWLMARENKKYHTSLVWLLHHVCTRLKCCCFFSSFFTRQERFRPMWTMLPKYFIAHEYVNGMEWIGEYINLTRGFSMLAYSPPSTTLRHVNKERFTWLLEFGTRRFTW